MTIMTHQEYMKKPAEYRGIVDGVSYLLQLDSITQATFYGPVTIGKMLKYAWRRDDSVPAGVTAKGRVSCPCGQAPLSEYDPSQLDIICKCGACYSWEGCIKGRSIGSDTLTAYRVIFEDGSEYSTSMSESTNLQDAYYYFMDRRIDGKLVVDVEPCTGK